MSALGSARVTCGNEFRGVALTTLEVPQIPAATLRCSLALCSARGSPPPFPQTLCSHHALKLQAPKLRQGHILGVLRVRGTIWRVVPSVLLRAIGCLDVVVVCHRNRPDASRVPVAADALTVGVSPHLRDVNWERGRRHERVCTNTRRHAEETQQHCKNERPGTQPTIHNTTGSAGPA